MLPEPRGCFHYATGGIEPGQRYLYVLGDGPARPDPASRWQPDGVHGASAVWSPDAHGWQDAAWRGVELGGQAEVRGVAGTWKDLVSGGLKGRCVERSRFAAVEVANFEPFDLDAFQKPATPAVLLLEASTVEPFDLAVYRDGDGERLRALIEAKVSGQTFVATPPAPEPQVVHLMEALRQSVERAQENGAADVRPRQRLTNGHPATAPKQRKARA